MVTVPELKRQAKAQGHKGYSRMNKAQLMRLVQSKPVKKQSVRTSSKKEQNLMVKQFDRLNVLIGGIAQVTNVIDYESGFVNRRRQIQLRKVVDTLTDAEDKLQKARRQLRTSDSL